MSEAAKVKKGCEAAGKVKTVGPSSAEAKATAQSWRAICDDPEVSAGLRSIATLRRRELEGAIARGDTQGEEAALLALNAIASQFSA